MSIKISKFRSEGHDVEMIVDFRKEYSKNWSYIYNKLTVVS